MCPVCKIHFTVVQSQIKRLTCSTKCAGALSSLRMKQNNPRDKPGCNTKISKALKAKYAFGELIPFMCTAKGKEVIGKIARIRALTNNPMKNPETAMKAYTNACKNRSKGKSSLEIKFENFAKKYLLPLEYVGDGSVWINHKNPDFRVIGQKKCIEIGVSYFRGSKYIQERQTHFAKYGWNCFVILISNKIKNESLLLSQINAFINDKVNSGACYVE